MLGEKVACASFPTLVHTVIHQLPSAFGNFSNGICHVVEINIAESNSDMELSTKTNTKNVLL